MDNRSIVVTNVHRCQRDVALDAFRSGEHRGVAQLSLDLKLLSQGCLTFPGARRMIVTTVRLEGQLSTSIVGLELDEATGSGRITLSLAALIRLQQADLGLDALGPAPHSGLEPQVGLDAGDPAALRQTREELASGAGAALLGRYQELRRRYRRAIVALRGGVCQGCFVRVPAAWGASSAVRSCERCGRILVPWRGEERSAKTVPSATEARRRKPARSRRAIAAS